jgi:hypothetical protein
VTYVLEGEEAIAPAVLVVVARVTSGDASALLVTLIRSLELATVVDELAVFEISNVVLEEEFLT